LCNEPVKLEKARINELGKAVHEECYLKMLNIPKTPSRDTAKKPDGLRSS
jgi:hypothetical protein